MAAYVALAAGYALATPAWNNPDEPAHFNYVRELAERGSLPVLASGDWDAERLEAFKAARFPPEASIDAIGYEGHQPPLYYLLAAPVYRLTDGWPTRSQVVALRALSIALGAVVVVAAYRAARVVAPDGAVPCLASATVAAIPMHTAMSAAINNDSLANAVAATIVVVLLGGLRVGFDDRRSIAVGLLLGAALLTKLTVYAFTPLVLGVVWWTERRKRAQHLGMEGTAGPRTGAPDPAPAWRRPALALAVAAAVSGWWFVRNMTVYGWADPVGLARHDAIVVGQPRWQALDATAADFFGRVLFRSFWGQFGWMGVVLDDRLYLIYLALTALGLLGLVVGWRGTAGRQRPLSDGAWPRTATAFLALIVFLIAAQVVYYNLTFIQPQGRYLFPALVPIGVLLALGWHALLDSGRPPNCHSERSEESTEPQVRRFFAALRMTRWMVAIPVLGAVLLAIASAWALADGVALLALGRFWPLRFTLPTAVLVGVIAVLASRRLGVRTSSSFALGIALFLLDAACLVRFVGPAFR